MKSLEDYAMSLGAGIISLETLRTFHARAIEIGIFGNKDDLCSRANTIIWDIDRDIKLYYDQLYGVLELLPDDFNVPVMVDKLKMIELTKARSMIRKPKVKKCDT
jgi:hypothetical protein